MRERMKSGRAAALTVAVVCGIAAGQPNAGLAAESATSFYLLGSKGSMAGATPPPGLYVVDFNYYYAGKAEGQAALGVSLQRTGARDTGGIPLTLDAKIKVGAQAYYQMPTAIWMTPSQFLGGNFGFSLITPIGWKNVNVDIDALATFTFPPPLSTTLTANRRLSLDDQRTAFGDPVASAFVGWHQGNWHWNVGATVNIPIGVWDTGRIANIGFNHWAFDLTGAATWFDPMSGFEVSAATGVTLNTENPDSNYKSGTDFHVEFAAMQHFSKQFAAGLVGYHYQQLTGDSGSGAVLGDFKGRVTAIGPAAIQLDNQPMRMADEVRNVRAHRRLTSKMQVGLAKHLP